MKTEPITMADFQQEIKDLCHQAHHGCLNGGCQIEAPTGLHTNGGCRCHPRKFARALFDLAVELEKHGYRCWPK